MRPSTQDISPFYTILVEAIDAYYVRTGTVQPYKDKTRAALLGVAVGTLSGIKRGRYPISGVMARRFSTILCVGETEQRALEVRLRNPATHEPDGTVSPPLIAFVRKWGKRDAALVIEHTGRWPFAWGFDYPDAPMIAAFREAMAAGMNVIIFLSYEVHDRAFVASMGDRFAETYAQRTFHEIARINPDRVGFYCLRENPCPTPDTGIRLTGLCPNQRHECMWLIPHGPHEDFHFVPTSTYPEDLIGLILGFAWCQLRDGNGPPTQEDLEQRWATEVHIRQIDGTQRPCPIRRIA